MQKEKSSKNGAQRDYRKNNNRSTGNRKPKYQKDDIREKSFSNDPTWYAADPALLRDSASIPFSWAYGTEINFDNPVFSGTAGFESVNNTTIPGLCEIKLQPCFGHSTEYTDPLSLASNSVYTFVRHMNSGSKNYDAPDLMIYILAMTQVYSYIHFLQRAYGLATKYSGRNRYVPAAIFEAMNINLDDVQDNMAEFRYGINVLINKAASFCVPANFNIFRRMAFCYSAIYSGSPAVKDQLYMFNPWCFMAYTLSDADSSGMLEIKEFATHAKFTVSELIEFGRDMLDRLLFSEDINVMSGDILKAYGDGGIFKLQAMSPDYDCPIVNDFTVLEQFKNATVLGTPLWEYSLVQDPTHLFLVSDPVVYMSGTDAWEDVAQALVYTTLNESKIMTTAADSSSPELIMEDSRLMVGVDSFERNGPDYLGHLVTGCEVAVQCNMYASAYDPATHQIEGYTRRQISYPFPIYITNNATGVNALALAMQTLSMAGYFKFHPALRVLLAQEGSTSGSVTFAASYTNFDVDNYGVIHNDDLRHIHETALLSLVAVPGRAKW